MQLPKEFPIPVAVCCAMSIQVWLNAHSIRGFRKTIFNQDFMEK
jgi:hypothetical protein